MRLRVIFPSDWGLGGEKFSIGGVLHEAIEGYDSQILAVLKQAESGKPVPDLCRECGISNATFYKLRVKCGGMDASPMVRMKELEEENRHLKKVPKTTPEDLEMSASFMRFFGVSRFVWLCIACFPSSRIGRSLRHLYPESATFRDFMRILVTGANGFVGRAVPALR